MRKRSSTDIVRAPATGPQTTSRKKSTTKRRLSNPNPTTATRQPPASGPAKATHQPLPGSTWPDLSECDGSGWATLAHWDC